MIKISFYDAETGAKRDQFTADLEKAIDEFYRLSDVDGTFFILEDSEGRTIQFAWDSEDNWIFDIPLPEKGGSFQKYVNYEECQEIIGDFYRGKIPDFETLKFFEWY